MKKEARAQAINAAENRRIHSEHSLQLQLREPDVDAIDVGDDVAAEEQRNEPKGDPLQDFPLIRRDSIPRHQSAPLLLKESRHRRFGSMDPWGGWTLRKAFGTHNAKLAVQSRL